MNVLTNIERSVEIEKLLIQYRSYLQAWFAFSKRKIGNEMIFRDPIVWIMYKHLAYQGTPQAITTWEDLMDHSLNHDGICGKRLDWLCSKVSELGVNLLAKNSNLLALKIPEFTRLFTVIAVADSEILISEWNRYEGNLRNGQRHKWGNYTQKFANELHLFKISIE